MFEVHPMGICSKIAQDSRLVSSVVQRPAGVQQGAKVKQESAAETINALFRGQRGRKDNAAENTGRSKCSIASVSASEALCSELPQNIDLFWTQTSVKQHNVDHAR